MSDETFVELKWRWADTKGFLGLADRNPLRWSHGKRHLGEAIDSLQSFSQTETERNRPVLVWKRHVDGKKKITVYCSAAEAIREFEAQLAQAVSQSAANTSFNPATEDPANADDQIAVEGQQCYLSIPLDSLREWNSELDGDDLDDLQKLLGQVEVLSKLQAEISVLVEGATEELDTIADRVEDAKEHTDKAIENLVAAGHEQATGMVDFCCVRSAACGALFVVLAGGTLPAAGGGLLLAGAGNLCCRGRLALKKGQIARVKTIREKAALQGKKLS